MLSKSETESKRNPKNHKSRLIKEYANSNHIIKDLAEFNLHSSVNTQLILPLYFGEFITWDMPGHAVQFVVCLIVDPGVVS